ncbi:type II CAAX endopeptidase family protein [Bacillus sp. FJAT-52991]|uniref:Type II CAAX endopeptidase family protein n=1 Tax=Bacillus kandeliae TaxID=3129297 RepID=A0ABZ2N2Z7_9BACI
MKKNKQSELIKQITDEELLKSLYMTQIALLLLSVIVGIFLFPDFSTFYNLFQWSLFEIVIIGAGAGIAVVVLDLCLMKWLPDQYYDDGGINERLFAQRSIGQIFLIAALVAISEEIFFRGMLQTSLGLVVTSLIFALIHIRYLSQWYLTLNVVLLSFAIGWLFEWTNNLAATIMMHFVIDFLLGLAIRRQAREKASSVREEENK